MLLCDSAKPTAGSGYTLDATTNVQYYEEAEYMLDAGSAAAKTVNYGHATTTSWGLNAIAIKAAGGAAQSQARGGIALSAISAINGITKSSISAINGLTI